MSSTSTNRSSSGIGFTGALFLVFLILKLTHVIDWSWWWITAPLWIPTGLAALFIGGLLVFVAWKPSKRSHLKQREQAQMDRRATLIAETEARMRAADERRGDRG